MSDNVYSGNQGKGMSLSSTLTLFSTNQHKENVLIIDPKGEYGLFTKELSNTPKSSP
ncbi:MAG TPA: hypothetical protein VHP31_00060 [Caproicibacter sp.]|nr:hypothetical protein [Caproicibacter sp.]